MSRCVIDASVAIKWFLPFKAEENHLDEAMRILDLFEQSKITCYQPPHFTAEMIGVLVRLRPEKAAANLSDLLNMDFQQIETADVYRTAFELAIRLQHHVFDTLYHAVALNIPGATLITADEAYFRKAHELGRIVRLQEYDGQKKG